MKSIAVIGLKIQRLCQNRGVLLVAICSDCYHFLTFVPRVAVFSGLSFYF